MGNGIYKLRIREDALSILKYKDNVIDENDLLKIKQPGYVLCRESDIVHGLEILRDYYLCNADNYKNQYEALKIKANCITNRIMSYTSEPSSISKNIEQCTMSDYDYCCKLHEALFDDYDPGDVYIKGTLDCIANLDERESLLIAMRFKLGLTLQECGNELHISKGRADQILNKVYRKLRQYDQRCNMRVSRIANRLSQTQSNLIDALGTIREYKTPKVVSDVNKVLGDYESVMGTLIEELGLSSRTLHCLRRCNINTVGELYTKPIEYMLQIRSLGVKSLGELRQKMIDFGFTDWLADDAEVID